MPGFSYAEINNTESVKKLLTNKTAAIMIEPIQGEGGVNACTQKFLKEIRELCDSEGILLLFDEVQVGMGRTGSFFCFEQYGIKPDLITLAKALGGGLPIGALLGTDEAMRPLTPGSHASTFGGNPFVCGVALEVVKILADPRFLSEVQRKGVSLRKGLQNLQKKFPFITNVKGKGLIIGLDLDDAVVNAADIPPLALKEGFLINAIGSSVIRLLPPLTVTDAEIEHALTLLETLFKRL